MFSGAGPITGKEADVVKMISPEPDILVIADVKLRFVACQDHFLVFVEGILLFLHGKILSLNFYCKL